MNKAKIDGNWWKLVEKKNENKKSYLKINWIKRRMRCMMTRQYNGFQKLLTIEVKSDIDIKMFGNPLFIRVCIVTTWWKIQLNRARPFLKPED